MVFITLRVHFWFLDPWIRVFCYWDNFSFWTGVEIGSVYIFGSGAILLESTCIFQVETFISGFLDLDTFLTHCPFKDCFT